MLKGGIAASQFNKANKLAKWPQPEATIPEATKRAVSEAEMINTLRGYPGMETDIDLLRETGQTGIEAVKHLAQDPSSAIAGVTGLNTTMTEGMADIYNQGLNFKAQNIDRLMRAYALLSEEEKRVFDLNQYQPWMAAMDASAALKGGAYENVANALDDLGMMGVALLQNQIPGTEVTGESTTMDLDEANQRARKLSIG